MAGTDRSRRPEAPPDGPAFVLVQPQMGENIGAAARAMWNFGLRRMRLVSPRDGWPNPAAVAMASGAGGLLDEAQLFATTAEAVADCGTIYATTARPREMTKRVLTPEAAMAEARATCAAGGRVAVLFGPERAGLLSEDVVLADAIVSVPVNPAFGSLNLAQCVLLTAYEWRREGEAVPAAAPERADSSDVGRLLDHLTAELDEAGFFFPEHKRAAMVANLHNLFRRAPLTDQEVRTLWGVVRALAGGPKRRR
ncbi:MAG TPA: RNA methyltransferase [Paracoccaceae bacterium]|nr:RNA methyltransferase [Paracoccaceae bacterium]